MGDNCWRLGGSCGWYWRGRIVCWNLVWIGAVLTVGVGVEEKRCWICWSKLFTFTTFFSRHFYTEVYNCIQLSTSPLLCLGSKGIGDGIFRKGRCRFEKLARHS